VPPPLMVGVAEEQVKGAAHFCVAEAPLSVIAYSSLVVLLQM